MHIPIINHLKRLAACCGLLSVLLPCAYAQQTTGHDAGEKNRDLRQTIHFRTSSAAVDGSYLGNLPALLRMDSILSDSALVSRIDSVNIYSFASPEGREAYNLRLARLRAATVKDYLARRHPRLDTCRIHALPQGENWREMRLMIARDSLLPCREAVLRIIDCNDGNPEHCKALLKKLDSGIPYRHIRNHVLPLLRNASVCEVLLKRDSLPHLPGPARPVTNAAQETGGRAYPGMTFRQQPETVTRRPLLAVKTNLLFDAAMMPNVEVEVPVGNRWSVNGELMFPWWLVKDDKYCLQILMGGVEGRYWLGSKAKRKHREVLTGHFLGLYAGAGKYDLQWDRNGYQGEFFIAAGISYGYAMRIARNLRLEFNLGIGLLRTNYEHYHAIEDYRTLLWQDSGRYTWLGPTKAKISFVWLLNRKVKVQKGGAR